VFLVASASGARNRARGIENSSDTRRSPSSRRHTLECRHLCAQGLPRVRRRQIENRRLPGIRSEPDAPRRFVPWFPEPGVASSAVGLHAAASCGRACGRGESLPISLFGRLFVVTVQLHLAKDALALHLLLQNLKGLVDIVVAHENLHSVHLFVERLPGRCHGARVVGIWIRTVQRPMTATMRRY
jgi:hypothetical protein